MSAALESQTPRSPNGIGVYDGLVRSAACQKLVNRFEDLSAQGVGHETVQQFQGDGLQRAGYALMLNDHDVDLTRTVFDPLQVALGLYMDAWPILKRMSFLATHCKIQRVTPGEGYHIWHAEQMNIDTANRVLVWLMYLNKVERGGETSFLYQSERVEPRLGRIVIWPAAFTHTHRGEPPLSGVKYVATGWYYLR